MRGVRAEDERPMGLRANGVGSARLGLAAQQVEIRAQDAGDVAPGRGGPL